MNTIGWLSFDQDKKDTKSFCEKLKSFVSPKMKWKILSNKLLKLLQRSAQFLLNFVISVKHMSSVLHVTQSLACAALRMEKKNYLLMQTIVIVTS